MGEDNSWEDNTEFAFMASIKLIWSTSSCAFCPRNAVRTCQIRPGKLLPKLSAALDMDEDVLSSAEGICTCCFTDVDMIIRAIAIKGAMKDYFLNDFPQHKEENSQSGRDYNQANRYSNKSENETKLFATEDDGRSSGDVKPGVPAPSLHLPSLVAMPPAPSEANSEPTQSLKKHMMYQCILCDKVAGSKSHCVEHLICHSAVRPFSCSHCRKTYKSRKACREHLVVMHGVEKVEAKLHEHMIVNQEDLKQLENVCTQYRQIYRGAKQSSTTSVKTEPKDDGMGSKSYWLYYGSMTASSVPTQPPPLIRCPPSNSTVEIPNSSSDQTLQSYQFTSSPPAAKRNRKGTPHKVVLDIADDDDGWDGIDEPSCPPFSFDGELSNPSTPMEHDSDSTSELATLPDLQKSISSKKSDAEYLSDNSEALSKNEWYSPNNPFVSSESVEAEPGDCSWTAESPSNNAAKRPLPPCEICGRTFPTKEKMADHKRSHSEIKQFSCLACNRFFKYRRGVTNHLKEVHRLKDRNEISALVASHEIGCVPVKDAAGKRKWVKTTELSGLSSDSESTALVSQKVIEDTLSTLVEEDANDNDSLLIPST